MASVGKPFHVEELIARHIYDGDADPDSDVIEVYVKRPRRKPGSDLIVTRRGQGYVFDGES